MKMDACDAECHCADEVQTLMKLCIKYGYVKCYECRFMSSQDGYDVPYCEKRRKLGMKYKLWKGTTPTRCSDFESVEEWRLIRGILDISKEIKELSTKRRKLIKKHNIFKKQKNYEQIKTKITKYIHD